jgi:hypothetical protein
VLQARGWGFPSLLNRSLTWSHGSVNFPVLRAAGGRAGEGADIQTPSIGMICGHNGTVLRRLGDLGINPKFHLSLVVLRIYARSLYIQ